MAATVPKAWLSCDGLARVSAFCHLGALIPLVEPDASDPTAVDEEQAADVAPEPGIGDHRADPENLDDIVAQRS